jgi:outer membrane protein assembly factor BamB
VRRALPSLLSGLLVVAAPFPGQAVELEQVITHETPLFKPREARLTVGRDGRVYLANWGMTGARPYGFVLRLDREGKEKVGAEVVAATFNATAKRDGVMATANPVYGGHQVAVYDPAFGPRGGVADFDPNSASPVHVEAGAGGDFYGLDAARMRVVRLSPDARPLATYPLPDGSANGKGKRTYRDFRVCEKTQAFYLLTHPDPVVRIVCVGFDGKDRWAYDGPTHRLEDADGMVAAYDVDEDGTLYVLDGEAVKKFDPDGKPAGQVNLRMGDARPGPGGPGYGYLRVHGDDLLLKRAHDAELFRRYDLKTGGLKGVVRTDHERLAVTFDGDVWTAGRAVPVRIELSARERKLSPRWRVWARPFASLDYREFPLRDGAVQVPADAAGLYLVKVTPEVRPWQRGSPADYLVRAVVEVRQPGTRGSATVLTPDNRTQYGRGEEIPFVVAVRGADPDRAVTLTVHLLDGERPLARARQEVKGNAEAVAFKVSKTLTAALRPGSYTLAVSAPGLSGTGQPLVIGPGLSEPPFDIVQYADYGLVYPGGARPGDAPDLWDAPDLTAAHAARTGKLGVSLVADRLGCQIDLLHHLAWPPADREELDALRRRLEAAAGGVSPRKASMAPPLLQTQAAYGAAGVRQMAILTGMDAGLPLGHPFDARKPEEFTRDLTRVTEALAPYPSFRGWIWAANWWVWEEGNTPGAPRRARDATTAEERAAYVAAFRQAEKTGAWDPVLQKVADRRLGYAVAAQELFNAALRKVAPGKVTAVSGPYRGLDVYPPLTYRNVDEVDLHYQAEQLQWPNVAPHDVDYQKRPGKRAWGHPEVSNDAGTGDQILPALFEMVMRGADGVGCSGSIPAFGPQPEAEDARSAYQGTTSVHRAAYGLLRQYGPWLTTLHNDDGVAIVVSGRMVRVDDWGGIGGRYFERLFEAYQSCLHAHYPASFVFAEDLTPDTFKRCKAVLVVGQTVEMEPELTAALGRARAAGAVIFHDDTCRPELVRNYTPLGVAFDLIGHDPSVWQDDAAYQRFPGYYRAHLPALTKALGAVLPPVAGVDGPEVLLSERAAEGGRYLFVVNNTVPDLDPGQLWHVTLAIATRVPVLTPVRLRDPGTAVYDVFALKHVTPQDGVVDADLRDLPARLYAILPAAIDHVELRGPRQVRAGQAFAWSAEVRDGHGNAIRASVPLRVRLLDAGGRVLDEQFTAAGSGGTGGTMRSALNAAPGAQTLEATELFSGQVNQLAIAVAAPAGPASLAAEESQPEAPADTAARAEGAGDATPPAESFGPHVRDLVLTRDGTLAVASAMNWDHNLYAVDVATGELRWRQRAGHYFAFAPQALPAGVAVQGYDLKSAEGYHLYLLDGDGRPERRFALYGLPRRLPHRFLPGIYLGDHVNNFALPRDGGWVAAAGDLGLAVWSRAGKLLWSRDWWTTDRHTAALAAPDADTLLAVEGMTATAYAARTGEQRWQVRLAPDGEALRVVVSPDGKTCAVQARAGGRVYVVRAGRVVTVIHGGSSAKNLHHMSTTGGFEVNGLDFSPDGSLLAVTSGNLLKLYSVAGGLRWILPADDVLHSPRFSPDGKRLAAGSELGTLYVLDVGGSVLLERDLGALPVPAWLPDGDLLAGTWMGTVCRLDGQYAERWRTRLRPAARDMRGRLLADDGAPTTRVAFRGNAEPAPAPLVPNLVDPHNAFIKLVWLRKDGEAEGSVGFAHDSAALMDGKPDPPATPWIGWSQMNGYGEGDPFTYVLIDTYRTRLRVTGITLVEDPAHPESWLRDATLESWDAARERWVLVQPLLSDAAVHTHRLARPVEAARFRLVLPQRLCGNLRLGEIVLHGEKLGPSHPDVVARRPVAVLFDEGNDLSGYLHRATVALRGAYSGTRCLTVGAEDAYSVAPWAEGSKVFGETLPNWDFEIAEEPKPGQYRYLQFAWRSLAPGTKGITLRLDGDGPTSTHAVTLYAGQRAEGTAAGQLKKLADAPPADWQVVRVDLWELLKKPVRIRGMRLASRGGSAAFDQILLGRTKEDLPPR